MDFVALNNIRKSFNGHAQDHIQRQRLEGEGTTNGTHTCARLGIGVSVRQSRTQFAYWIQFEKLYIYAHTQSRSHIFFGM